MVGSTARRPLASFLCLPSVTPVPVKCSWDDLEPRLLPNCWPCVNDTSQVPSQLSLSAICNPRGTPCLADLVWILSQVQWSLERQLAVRCITQTVISIKADRQIWSEGSIWEQERSMEDLLYSTHTDLDNQTNESGFSYTATHVVLLVGLYVVGILPQLVVHGLYSCPHSWELGLTKIKTLGR